MMGDPDQDLTVAKQEGERAEETFTTDLMAELEQYLF